MTSCRWLAAGIPLFNLGIAARNGDHNCNNGDIDNGDIERHCHARGEAGIYAACSPRNDVQPRGHSRNAAEVRKERRESSTLNAPARDDAILTGFDATSATIAAMFSGPGDAGG
jgi:hypothetical protein